MFKTTHLITLNAELDEKSRLTLSARFDKLVAALPGPVLARCRPSLEGSVNGGDIVCHLQFVDEAAYRQCLAGEAWRSIDRFCSSHEVDRCDWAAYRQEELEIRQSDIVNGIHRVLLLAIKPFSPADKVLQFEAEMRNMPAYLPAIRNWGFSRIVEGGGARCWTHVWEQDFADAGGLFGPYMMHPIHFAHIDRWFDTQSHDWIVDPELCSTYCSFETSALALLPQGSA
jgi:Stress responsive A/B Barrel Domain